VLPDDSRLSMMNRPTTGLYILLGTKFSMRAGCGANTGEGLTIRDDGVGGCTFRPHVEDTDFAPCVPLYKSTCRYFYGNLFLTSVINPAADDPNALPRFQSHLNTVGLGNLTGISALNIHFIQTVKMTDTRVVRPSR
jgi:hypothetical protein